MTAIVCLLGRRLVRGALVLATLARPGYGLLRFLLEAKLSAVLDLRQQLANPLNIALAPNIHVQISHLHGLGGWDLLGCNVPAESGGIQP